MPDVNVTFIHPVDSTKTCSATLSTVSTPSFVLEKLVQSGFVPAPRPGAPYALITPDGRRLDPNTPLEAAGVVSDIALTVVPEHQGAANCTGVDRTSTCVGKVA